MSASGQSPLIFQHVLDNDSLRFLGNKRPMADSQREGHFRLQETAPIADDGMCACQQRDTNCFALKSDRHGVENGICTQADSIILMQRRQVIAQYSGTCADTGRVLSRQVRQVLVASDSAQTLNLAPMSSGVAEVALHIFRSVATLSLLFAGSAGPLPFGYCVPFVWGNSRASLSRNGT